jgi:small subunit ribosomal protein S4
MGRYLGSVCKLCRREKDKLFLKGERCSTNCTLDRNRGKNLPGGRSSMRMKMSEYAKHHREKQKGRRIYGLTEEQFKRYYKLAAKAKGMTGENLLRFLELRLDNVVYRLGLVTSRRLARQIITHRWISVNEKCINLPGYPLKAGDKITIKGKYKENANIKRSIERNMSVPTWLTLDQQNLAGTVVNPPSQGEFSFPIDSQLIVELYSK